MPRTYEVLSNGIVQINRKTGLQDYCYGNNLNVFSFNGKVIINPELRDCSYMFNSFYSLNQPLVMPLAMKKCDYMFADCKGLNQKIVLPEGLITCNSAFAGCESLEEQVLLPDSVIECNAVFDDCNKYNHIVVLPETVNMFIGLNKTKDHQNIFVGRNSDIMFIYAYAQDVEKVQVSTDSLTVLVSHCHKEFDFMRILNDLKPYGESFTNKVLKPLELIAIEKGFGNYLIQWFEYKRNHNLYENPVDKLKL